MKLEDIEEGKLVEGKHGVFEIVETLQTICYIRELHGREREHVVTNEQLIENYQPHAR